MGGRVCQSDIESERLGSQRDKNRENSTNAEPSYPLDSHAYC